MPAAAPAGIESDTAPDTRYTPTPKAVHTRRYAATTRPVAGGQGLERRATETMNGSADGAIIAAVIGVHVRTKDGNDPMPISVRVFVPAVDPPRADALLVAALRHDVQVVVADVQHVQPSRVRRVGVVDPAVVAPREHADARRLGPVPDGVGAVVVVGLARRQLFRSERHPVVEVEVGPLGRVPREYPAHALPVRGELLVGRVRHGG